MQDRSMRADGMHIDPRDFTDAAISDETRAFNEQLRRLLLAMTPTYEQSPREVRAARLEGRGPFGPVVHSDHARTITIDGPGGDLDLRVIEVEDDTTGVYVHVHGGGWVLGAADHSDVGNEAMARAAGVSVVSIDYRLAPEHRFPAGLDDCVAAARWIIENAEAEFGTTRLTIGGESAGANLAAATLLRIRDEVGYTDWRGANLVYGVFQPTGTPSVKHWNRHGYVLDRETMEWFGEHYVGDIAVAYDDPRLAPLNGDLSDMPPALFTIGTLDPLLDDTLFMAARWAAAGAETHLGVYPGGVHAFDAFPTDIGLRARTRMHEFIHDVTAATGRAARRTPRRR
jgi:acetyl esterase/lipase